MRQVRWIALLLIVFSCTATRLLAGDIPDWVPPDAVEAANRLWREEIERTSSFTLSHDFGFGSALRWWATNSHMRTVSGKGGIFVRNTGSSSIAILCFSLRSISEK